MKYRYLSDCHVHTVCSSDASDSAVMMCESAARHGLLPSQSRTTVNARTTKRPVMTG